MICLLIADDFPITLDGPERLFAAERDISVVARCSNIEETKKAIQEHRPDVVLVGLSGGEGDALEAVRTLHARLGPAEAPQPKIVLFVDSLSERAVLDVIRLGVRGTVLKHMPPGLLVTRSEEHTSELTSR